MSSKRNVFVVAVVVLAVVAVAAYALFRNSQDGDRNTVSAPSVPDPLTGATAAQAKKPDMAAISKYFPQALSVPKYVESSYKPKASIANPAQLISETEHAAQTGSAPAMYWMALGLRKCERADASSNDEIESKVAKRSIGKEAMDADKGRVVEASEVVKRASDSAQTLEQLRDDCKKVASENLGSWQSWMEKSAAAGDSTARGEFAHSVADKFKDPLYKEENYAEYNRENNLATQYLNDSVANGDCSNDVLNGFRWVNTDPETKYVYQSLLIKHTLQQYSQDTETPQSIVDREMTSLNASLKNLASYVTPDQFAVADGASNYILQSICKFPQ